MLAAASLGTTAWAISDAAIGGISAVLVASVTAIGGYFAVRADRQRTTDRVTADATAAVLDNRAEIELGAEKRSDDRWRDFVRLLTDRIEELERELQEHESKRSADRVQIAELRAEVARLRMQLQSYSGEANP